MPPLTPSIRPLPDHVINQIAAGEVIERPASVIKELVENSLDAGARRIAVEIGEGGLEFMTVSDDGCGIAGAEIGAALRRHWTSKIATTNDLASLASLGFRGEALASIAAVATLEVITRRRDEAHGWRLRSLPGQAPAAPVPHQANPGTRITVRELFHCVPARRRFLKRARTEFLHVQQLLRQLAFARPDVAFEFTQAGSRGLRFAPAVLGEDGARWRSLFGADFVAGAHWVDLDADGVRVRGWVGGAALADSQSDSQFLALNGRYVRDRQLAHAVRLAYGDALPSGRFPVYALAVELEPAAVDVNVHPGKLEVRFADVRAVHDVLHVAVRRALQADLFAAAAPASRPSVPRGVAEVARASFHAPPERRASAPRAAAPAPVEWRTPALALVDERFLLYREDGQVRALDLRAAWREVLARRLRGAVASRPLLIPARLAEVPRDVDLAVLGFEVDDLGPAGHLLRAVPVVLPTLPWPTFFATLARVLERDPVSRVALAAADSLELGRDGQPARRLLDELAQGAHAAGVALDGLARRVDARLLDAAARDHG